MSNTSDEPADSATARTLDSTGEPSPFRVAMVGCGTVGSGVVRILRSLGPELIRQRAGRDIELRRIVVRNPERDRGIDLADVQVSRRAEDIADDPEIDVVIEVIGGIDPARAIVGRMLESGKDVITANKALLQAHGRELFALAQSHDRTIGFEAAVAGGIPVISALCQALTGNRIRSVEAILNGTSNFILSQMLECGQTYDEVLAEAQQLGYAEADPTMDVDGTDAAQKLCILTQLAFGTPVQPSDFVCQGIQDIHLLDLETACDLGYRVKLLATARLAGEALELWVQPTLVRADRSVAQTDGADNIIAVDSDAVGLIRLSGAGAGQMPTASAVVADLIDAATGRAAATFRSLLRLQHRTPLPLLPMEQLGRRYYLRYNVADQPHVLADVADVLGRNLISISSVHQDETPEESHGESGIARLVIMTHRTTEGRVAQAHTEISALAATRGPGIRMPVAD